jgi:hypothetical protein
VSGAQAAKSVAVVLAVLLSVCAAVSPAGAEVLGRRHIGIGIGTTWVGEYAIDRNSLDFSARIRLPVNGNFDIVAFHQQAMLEGHDPAVQDGSNVKMKSSEYGVGLSCHFLPQRQVDPFLKAGLSNAMADTIVDGKPTYADEHLMIEFGGGAEINLRRNISLILGAAYHDSLTDSSVSDVSAGLSLNGWLNDLILVGVGVEGVFDTGDISALAMAAYAF